MFTWSGPPTPPPPDGVANEHPSWARAGEAGEEWLPVRLSLPPEPGHAHKVVLEAGLGENDHTDLGHAALDDFLLTDGSCSALNSGECSLRSVFPFNFIFVFILTS